MGLYKKLLDVIPSAVVSRAFGAVADIALPAPLQKGVNRTFAKLAGIDTQETAIPVDDFSSLSALFTRELKPGARSVDDAGLVSPVDGKISFAGNVDDGMLLEAKGRAYSVSSLVGTSDTDALEWLQKAYAFTIYLSPRNYHRIHAPMAGNVTGMVYVPGRLLPVNRLGYMMADDLLPANERLTSFISGENGHRCALVKVGATCVGKISVNFDGFVSNASMFRNRFERRMEPVCHVNAGDQIGCFDLGSTVVLLVDRNGFVPASGLVSGMTVRMGQKLGDWNE